MTSDKVKIGIGYHIMVVDDEEKVAKFLYEMLKNRGYEVTVFSRSNEALEFFLANSESIDLVITDQTMPELTGAELSQQLLSKQPDLPIFLVTGFSEEIDSDKANELGIKEYISKPLKLADLANTLQHYLPANKRSQTA